jgi:hypothetical protein
VYVNSDSKYNDRSLNFKFEAWITGFVNPLGSFYLYGCVLVQYTVNNHPVGRFDKQASFLTSEQVDFTETQYKAT